MMALVTAEIDTEDGAETVRHCVELGNGLIANPTKNCVLWTITHRKSGIALADKLMLISAWRLKKVLPEICEITDWTRDAEDILSDDEVAEKMDKFTWPDDTK